MPPADWVGTNQPTFGFVHRGRLWGGGNANDPHRLYYSPVNNHSAVNDGSISIFSGEGEYISGAISFRGLIIVFKYPKGVYAVNTESFDIAQWSVSRISPHVGLAGPRALTLVDNDVLFIDQTAQVNPVSAVEEFGNLATQNLSSALDVDAYLRERFNLDRIPFARSIFYTAKRRVEFAMPTASSSINDDRLIVDYNIPERPRFLENDRDECLDIWLRKDVDGIQRPVVSDNSGFIWLLDRESRTKDGQGYSAEFTTLSTDFAYLDSRLANTRKNGQFLEVSFQPTGQHSLMVDVLWDDVLTQTINFQLGTTSGALGDFVLGF